MKYVTLSTAKKYIKTLFPDYPRVSEVSLKEAYKATGREDKDDEANKSWLTNRMTHLRHYGLVESVYSDDSPAKFIGVRLTQEGRKALDSFSANGVDGSREVTLETIARDLREYERTHPSIELNLDVKIKREVEAVI